MTAPLATMIDLTRLPRPLAIEDLDFKALQSAFMTRFVAEWTAQRAKDPTLPAFDVGNTRSDPVVLASRAFSYVRLLDRTRVNDAVAAVLAPLARGADLDNVAARLGVERLVLIRATDTEPAVMESDDRLLRRYLLAFSRPSAGSAARYLYEALTAWPQLLDAAVIGRAVHGRRGDTDVVLVGPDGRAPVADEIALVRERLAAPGVKPEATSVAVGAATRRLYSVEMTIQVSRGPDASAVAAEVEARVRKAGQARLYAGAEVPRDLLAGAAYGLSVIRADMPSPAADIPPDPYTVPVFSDVTVTPEVVA
ncbi:baseplate J/gp47 family protein [Xanthobacter sp.]|uniref:baseplate J/gp47 family protein n=1 Tax=Xanthobacter sp. TaxID=35809 RepID=UPI0025FB5841|nr:baseplate J/gp47 family protein [Xanthobacter sp.]